MEDSKRLILFIIASVGILIGWGILFPNATPKKTKPPIAKHAAKKRVSPRANTNKGSSVKKVATKNTQGSGKSTTLPANAKAAPKTLKTTVPERSVVHKAKLYQATITNQGGGINAMLLNKFWGKKAHKVGEKDTKLNIISKMVHKRPPFIERLLDSSLVTTDKIIYTKIDTSQPDVIRLEGKIPARNGGFVKVEKRYIFIPNTYRFQIKYVLTNLTKRSITSKMTLVLKEFKDPKTVSSGGMFSRPEQTQVLCKEEKEAKPKRFDSQKLSKKASQNDFGTQSVAGNIGYVGIDKRYFVMAIVPKWGHSDRSIHCAGYANSTGWIKAEISNKGVEIAPKKTYQFEVVGYFGPKYYDNLKKVGGHLESSIDFGFFAFLSKPMLWTMHFFYSVFEKINISNRGISIILLTLLVKLILWPLTQKSMKSMKKMQNLKPQMDKLKEKYGDDKETYQRETMNLYVKEGINPVSGCLPMLLQMPIWIALYNTLFYAVELYQAPFIPGWIDDLSSKDPVFVLPLALGVAMFFQQRLTPQTLDSAQAKIMNWVMPIFFTGIMLFLPAGLTLYILVNTVLGVAHHWHIHNSPDTPEKKKPAKKKGNWMGRMQKYIEEQQDQGKK